MNMAHTSTVVNATRWSLIVRAQGSGADTRVALGELMAHYEGFVLWLIRQHRHPPDVSAEELKQEFLEGVLRRNDIAKLDRERGSFRGWLRMAVRRFVMNEWDKWRVRSKPSVLAQLDPNQLSVPAEDVCMREFARHVVCRALALQRRASSDVQRFDALARFLPGPQLDPVEYSSLSDSLESTPGALAKDVCVLRARFRNHLREAIRDLLDLERDVEAGADDETAQRACSRAIDEELRELRRHFWS
jgi:DNA-directed RNA polymerase specialized sigma24 family protein